MSVIESTVRTQMAAASRRIGRLKRIDRTAVGIITLGGVAVVVGVLGILVFIAAEAVPLFRTPRLAAGPSFALPAVAGPGGSALRAFGADEYRRHVYTIEGDARVTVYGFGHGRPSATFAVPGLDPGTRVLSSSCSLLGGHLAAGTTDGRVALMTLRMTPQYAEQRLVGVDVVVQPRGVAEVDPERRPVREVAHVEQDGRRYIAAIVADDTVALWRAGDDGQPHRALVTVQPEHRLTHVRLGRNGVAIAATDRGRLYRWTFDDEMPQLTEVVRAAEEPITALEFLIGGSSLVVGTASGQVTGWFRAAMPDGAERMVRAQVFEPQRSAVIAFAASPRERSFAALGADGVVVLRHQTSVRTLARVPAGSDLSHLVMTPKADGLVAFGGRRVRVFTVHNPHPEASWRSLFRPVWYEGYPAPEYVWQSTGATDDFESKLSLVPLVFGTIKGTFYAMLFAVPIAVLGSLYTSQFVHASIRAKIKPTIEIMAALPSVVVGFLAGLLLASVVEKNLVAVFLMVVAMPLSGTAGFFLWRALPRSAAERLPPGSETVVIVLLLVLAGWVSLAWGPTIEGWLFAGDIRHWLQQTLGLTYDQRNCLVVGVAMGFAVIPIIFTISEDAFSSVPSSLTAASEALGASRWQTAVRVVLPTASPGVFSAIMVGFGRAVGETMIVLMATGNTPVMDWSIFNGIRTLAANIAVEIPEAPYGGSLYRTLFLAAAVLFAMTFVVNTVAEIIRQRLRDRYRAV